ncbi:MAG: hypothetical protein ACI9LO_002822 [Planctomycetota bacterium]|jgi:membrane protein implicated in regulation of membrane protease activity
MPWWGWMIIGALLLGAELMGVDAAFYLVFIGIAAGITGLIELSGAGLEPWVQWMVFSAIAIVFMVLFRKKLYTKLRGDAVGYEAGPVGELITLEEKLKPGEKGRLKFRGTDWTVINESDETFEAGSRARIGRVDSLTIKLESIT